MTQVITLENGNEVEAGCWLDGAAGWTNSYRIVDIATHHGMKLDAEDAAVVEWYRETGNSDADDSDETLDKLEAMTGQGGITDKAVEYIGEQLPEGWVLNVEMGEYIVMMDWVECAAEGGNCEVDVDDAGNIVLTKRCPDHNPCEGHVGEDSDLLNPNVGMGETTYCNGSCVKR